MGFFVFATFIGCAEREAHHSRLYTRQTRFVPFMSCGYSTSYVVHFLR